MKKLIYVVIALAFASCKKEYTCNNGAVYKKGSFQYDQLQKGQTLTDINGQELQCH